MKLITKAIEKALPPLNGTSNTPTSQKKCIVKFFTPWGAATWWAVEGEKQEDGDWLFHGMVTLWGDFAEWGDFRLSELTELEGPFRLKVERDMERFGF